MGNALNEKLAKKNCFYWAAHRSRVDFGEPCGTMLILRDCFLRVPALRGLSQERLGIHSD